MTYSNPRLIPAFWGFGNGSMIVSRMQDHAVETADGAMYMMMNMGYGRGLTLFVSADGGRTWTESASIADAKSPFGSSDIQLSEDGQTLYVTYLSDGTTVTVASYAYDAENLKWLEQASTTIDDTAYNPFDVLPTLAIGPTGRLWSSFAAPGTTGLDLTVSFSDDDGATWTSLETTFAAAESGVARMIATDTGVGVIVASADQMAWLTYTPVGWVTEIISENGTAGSFSSHFSTAVVGGDVYLSNVTPDGVSEIFLRTAGQSEWTSIDIPAFEGMGVTTTQVSVSDTGIVYVVVDDVQNDSFAIASTADSGETWSVEEVPYPAGYTPFPTRFETPEYFSGDLVISLQAGFPIAPNINGIAEIRVDVDGDGLDTAADESTANTSDTFVFFDTFGRQDDLAGLTFISAISQVVTNYHDLMDQMADDATEPSMMQSMPPTADEFSFL